MEIPRNPGEMLYAAGDVNDVKNPLTATSSPAGQQLVRNVIRWCLSEDTQVYVRSPAGDRPLPIGELHRRFTPDRFQVWDGHRWTDVPSTSVHVTDETVCVKFRNGETVLCTPDHMWPTVTGERTWRNVRADELHPGDIVPSVRLPAPVDAGCFTVFPDEHLGWLCGAVLAAGTITGSDTITFTGAWCQKPELVTRLERFVTTTKGTFRASDDKTVTVTDPTLVGLVNCYIEKTVATKNLNGDVWNRSDEFLHALLDGYVRSVGWYDELNGGWQLNVVGNVRLVRELRTLGARTGVRVAAQPLPHRSQIVWRCDITFGTTPGEPGKVMSVTRLPGRRRFIGIGVDGEPHLFTLGSGLLTHNCRQNPLPGYRQRQPVLVILHERRELPRGVHEP